jgi:hypothetical protein
MGISIYENKFYSARFKDFIKSCVFSGNNSLKNNLQIS